jgi:hypothetical protein
VITGNSSTEFVITPPPPATNIGPNGLAYDAVNGRFYYCDYPNTTTLYFWDTAQHVAGSIGPDIAAADFYNGKYYYIAGGLTPPTDDLYEVAFNPDGTIASGYPNKLADIAGNAHGWTFNGDIAIKGGVVYGWGLCDTHKQYEFFTYDLNAHTFTIITVSYPSSLQLAFGSNGILYGHKSAGNGEFYVVDTTNGNVSVVTPMPNPGNLYTDLASGMLCGKLVCETAWAEGQPFPGKDWATYFTYIVQ